MDQVLMGEQCELEVRGNVTVNGAVDGATVYAGAALTVNGALSGHLQIEEGGVALANGAVTGLTANNQGMIMVSGAIELSSQELDGLGNFAVTPGSVVNRGVLERDGSLRAPVDGESLNVSANEEDWCVWLRDEQAFVPLTEIRRRTTELDAAAATQDTSAD